MRKMISVLIITVMLGVPGCCNVPAGRTEATAAGETYSSTDGSATKEAPRAEETLKREEPERLEDGSWAFYMYVCGSDLESRETNMLSFVTEIMVEDEAQRLKQETDDRNKERLKNFVRSMEENGLTLPQSFYTRTQILDYQGYSFEHEESSDAFGHIYDGLGGDFDQVDSGEAESEQLTPEEYDERFFSADEGSASGDFMEMMQAARLPENVKFVIMTGGAKSWSDSLIDCNRVQTFLLDSEGFTEIENEPIKNMGNGETLEGFLKFCRQNYPAEHMACLFWDHGAGCFGFAFDELYNDTLSLRELEAAFAEVFENDPEDPPLEFIGFDACLMGSLEVAEALSGYAGYLLASEETEPSTGWDYETWISRFTENTDMDARELCRIISDSYIDTTVKIMKEFDEEADITMSVTDLSKAKDLYSAYERLAEKVLSDSLDNSDMLSLMSRSAAGATRFSGESHCIYNTIDLGMFISKMPEVYPEEQRDLMALLKEAVVYKSNTEFAKEAMGISVYYPITIKDLPGLTYFLMYVDDICKSESISDLYYYKIAGCLSSERQEGLKALGLSEVRALNSDCLKRISDCEIGISEDNTLELQLGKDEFDLIQNACLNVAAYDSEIGNVIYLGADCFVGMNDDFTVVSGFDGQWLSLGGEPLFVEVIDVGEDYIKYSSPVLYDESVLKLHVIFDIDTGETHLAGLFAPSDENARLSRRHIELKDGDVLTPIYVKGNIDSPKKRQVLGKSITYSKEMDVEDRILDDGEYVESITFFNIRGDEYQAPVVSFHIKDSKLSGVRSCEEVTASSN